MNIPIFPPRAPGARFVPTLLALALPLAGLFVAVGLVLAPGRARADAAFIVNLTTDQVDANIGDGRCDIDNVVEDGLERTLRAALQEANFLTTGRASITFGGSGDMTISPSTNLPQVLTPMDITGRVDGQGAP
ncbi:MAG: hypothetical protein WEB00_15180 [Dehalococcoidia bacterium]